MELPEDIPRAHLPLAEAFEDLDEAFQLYEDGMTARSIPLALQPAWRTFLRARHDPDTPSVREVVARSDAGSVF